MTDLICGDFRATDLRRILLIDIAVVLSRNDQVRGVRRCYDST